MKFVYNDGGRKDTGRKGDCGDCVARSISIASGKSYDKVYTFLANGNDTQRKSKHARKGGKTARNGIHTTRQWFKDYMRELGFRWVPCMAIGSGCKVHLKDGEVPNGRLVVSLSKHYCAVIDGVIHDLYDPSRDGTRCVYGYWYWLR